MKHELVYGRQRSRKDIARSIPEWVQARIVRGGAVEVGEIDLYAGLNAPNDHLTELSVTPPEIQAELKRVISEHEQKRLGRVAVN